MNRAPECKKCGGRMRRNELVYRIAIIVASILLPFAGIFEAFSRSGEVPSFLSWLSIEVIAWLVGLLLVSVLVINVYQSFDPKLTYRCKECGHIQHVKREIKISLSTKIAIVLFAIGLVFVFGLIAILAGILLTK